MTGPAGVEPTAPARSAPGTAAAADATAGPLLRIEDLKVWFPITEGIIREKHIGDVRAIDGVSFDDGAAARRSGSSASRAAARRTTGRAIIRLYKPTTGRIVFDGMDIAGLVRARRSAGCAGGCR